MHDFGKIWISSCSNTTLITNYLKLFSSIKGSVCSNVRLFALEIADHKFKRKFERKSAALIHRIGTFAWANNFLHAQ